MPRSLENFSPPEPEADRFDRRADDSSREAAEKAAEPGDFMAEIGRDAESARRGIAEAIWGEPGRFAAASAQSIPELKPFLKNFSGLGDDVLLTEALKRDRDAARAAVGRT